MPGLQRFRGLSVCASVALFSSYASLPAQQADFGDMGGSFPTTLSQNGPYHVDVSHEWIGLAGSVTTTEPDAKIPDLDEDDGGVTMANVFIDGTFASMGRFGVTVTTDTNDAVRYINAAADLNGDGVFQTYPVGANLQYEWIAVNLPVLFEDETKVVTAHFTLHGPMVAPPPVRVTLSTNPIPPQLFGPAGWDGSWGRFERGETEDHPVPILLPYDYRLSESGVRETFSQPLIWFWPTNAPPASPPGYQDPKGWPPAGAPPQQPRKPNDGLAPYTPESDEPPRIGNDPLANPVVTNNTVKGMPDIKQGTNQCVPTATANSMSYLYRKANMQPPADDAFNKKLQEELARAMGTTASHGTRIDTADPAKNKFLQGKASANIDPRLKNGKVTITRQNPNIQNIMDAVDKGYDIEIVLTSYDADGTTNAQHMVTVVGYAVRSDGSVELKIHDPNDKEPGEQAGHTAHPPRESTLTVKPYENGKGGLRVTGGVRHKGHTLIITHLFVERLAPRAVTYPFAVHTSNPNPAWGDDVMLWDDFNPVLPTRYHWMKDGIDIPGATSREWLLEHATTEDSGLYQLWIFDDEEEFYAISPEIIILVEPPKRGTCVIFQ